MIIQNNHVKASLVKLTLGETEKLRMLYSCVLLLVLIADLACAGQTMTLEECLQTGLENNPSLNASRFQVESSGSDIKAARADFLPSLSSSYSASSIFEARSSGRTNQDYLDQDIRSFTVKLSQILYAGSRIVNTYKKAKLMKQASEAQLRLSELELSYNIETTFYQLMKAREDTVSAKDSVSRLKESVKSAEAFLRKELVPYVDVLKARVDLADAEDQLSQAKNNENRQREALFALMNLPMDQNLRFTNGDYRILEQEPTFEESFQYAIENRPDLKSLNYQLQAANKQRAIAAGKYLPTATFDIGYYKRIADYAKEQQTVAGSYNLDENNNYMMAGVTLSWSLFDGGRAYYENEKYSFEVLKFQALITDAKNTISTGIRKALYSIMEAKQRLASSTEALSAANQNYTSEDKRLKAGISTMQTLLDAQSRLVRAQSNKINAMLDYQLAQSELKLMRGGDNPEDNFH